MRLVTPSHFLLSCAALSVLLVFYFGEFLAISGSNGFSKPIRSGPLHARDEAPRRVLRGGRAKRTARRRQRQTVRSPSPPIAQPPEEAGTAGLDRGGAARTHRRRGAEGRPGADARGLGSHVAPRPSDAAASQWLARIDEGAAPLAALLFLDWLSWAEGTTRPDSVGGSPPRRR